MQTILADTSHLAFMLRYVFALLLILLALYFTRRAWLSLHHDLVYGVVPVPGYQLLLQKKSRKTGYKSNTEGAYRVPLYHTTCIGKSAACDLRIRENNIGARHVLIYRYDGDWFLQPVSKKHTVYLNGVPILPVTPLEHGDEILIGSYSLIFSNFSQANTSRGHAFALPLTDLTDAWQPNQFNQQSLAENFTGLWFLVNLFIFLNSILFYRIIPDLLPDLKPILAFFLLAIVVIVNLYYLLLPLISRKTDKLLLLVFLLLLAWGFIIQTRLSGLLSQGVLQAVAEANSQLSTSANSLSLELVDQLNEYSLRIFNGLKTQGLAIVIGLVLLPFTAIIIAKTRLLEPLSVLCIFLTPALLIATLAFGHGSQEHGATLWINLGNVSIQLTEFAKITYIIVLASFFKNRPSLKKQLFFAAWAVMVLFLIMLLPDLGMVMILLPVTVLVYVVMTSEYFKTFVILVLGSGVSLLAYAVFPHIQKRLSGWTTLWLEVNDSNRQIVYGLQAMARGGLLGRGFGNGNPGGIPLASSDMVFAPICEEWGLIGALAIVIFFIVIWLRSARIALTSSDGFTSGLALAAGTMFFVEAAIVMAGVAGLLPLTGVTLPFLAEGGSSLLAKILLMGILLGLAGRESSSKANINS